MRMVGSETADFSTARFLLKPGRSFEEAVQLFKPYTEIKEIYVEGRKALLKLLIVEEPGKTKIRYIYINNRFEGCSLKTILAVLMEALKSQPF